MAPSAATARRLDPILTKWPHSSNIEHPYGSNRAPAPEAASVVATLRQRIVDGRYPPGTRLAEIPVADALGVSRTPVRLAFRTLEQEGLLEKTGKRGLVVRAFTQADVLCAIEVRGALEGLAARRLAERGHQP
jgi:GntR family transcriptional regulator of vanillate catabolism